jgi:glutaredoxin
MEEKNVCIPHKIEVYTVDGCPYCQEVKRVLNERNIPFKEIKIETEEVAKKVMELTDGILAVPITVIDDTVVVRGFDKDKLPTSPCKD